jgi:hypothetical protein
MLHVSSPKSTKGQNSIGTQPILTADSLKPREKAVLAKLVAGFHLEFLTLKFKEPP